MYRAGGLNALAAQAGSNRGTAVATPNGASKSKGTGIAIGIALGAGIGTAMGAAMGNMGGGLAIGIPLGIVLGVALEKSRQERSK